MLDILLHSFFITQEGLTDFRYQRTGEKPADQDLKPCELQSHILVILQACYRQNPII